MARTVVEPVDAAASAPPERVLPASTRGWQLVIGLLLVAGLARVGVALAISGDYQPATDALQFDGLATQIANGNGYTLDPPQPPMIGPSALRAPGYPYVLAVIYLVFGDHAWTEALLANALLGVVAVALVGVIAAQLLGRRAAAVALAVAAVYPPMVLTGSSLQLEPLITVLCLGGLAAALQHRRQPRGLRWPIVAGVCLGLGVLTREQAAFFLPPVAWLLWTADGRSWPSWGDRVNLRSAAVAAATAVLVVLPWTIRNATTLDAFVPVTTSSGFGLVGTYNESSFANRARWLPPYNDPRAAQVLLELENPTEVRVDHALREVSFDLVKEHPSYPVEVAFWNTLRGFDLDGGAYTRYIAPYLPYPQRLLWPSIISGWVLLALAIVGTRRRETRAVPLAVWAIPVLLTAFMAVFLPFSIRYRSLLEPFTILLACSTLLAAIDRFSGGRRPETDEPPAAPVRQRRVLVADPDPSLG